MAFRFSAPPFVTRAADRSRDLSRRMVDRLRQGALARPRLTRAALIATDPPYLVGYDGTNRPGSRATLPTGEKVTWDDPRAQEHLFRNFCRVALAQAVRENAAWYCFQ